MPGSEARRSRAAKPFRNEGEGDKLAIRCQQVPDEEIFFIPADHFGSNLKFFERVQGSPELNRLGRDHRVPATFRQFAQEPGPGYQVQPADIQNCEIMND